MASPPRGRRITADGDSASRSKNFEAVSDWPAIDRSTIVRHRRLITGFSFERSRDAFRRHNYFII
jgi:hypothetical protein